MKKLGVILSFGYVINVFATHVPLSNESSGTSRTPLLDAMKNESKRNILIQGTEALIGSSAKGLVNTVGNVGLTTGNTVRLLTSPHATIIAPYKSGYTVAHPVVKIALKPFKQIARIGKTIWLADSKRAADHEIAKLNTENPRTFTDKILKPANLQRNKKGEVMLADRFLSDYEWDKAVADSRKYEYKYSNTDLPTLSGKAGTKGLEKYYTDELKRKDDANIDLKATRAAQRDAMEKVAREASLGTKLFKRKSLKAAMKEAAKNVKNVLITPSEQVYSGL